MRRKTRGMEKVENLYCTARVQHAMPRRQRSRDRERGAGRLKSSRCSRNPAPKAPSSMRMRIAVRQP